MLGVIAALTTLQTLCLLSAFILLPRWITRLRADVTCEVAESVRSFVTSPDENTPSPLAQLADQCALLLVGRAQQAIEARMRGAHGAAARDEGNAQVAEAIASGPSWLPIVAQFLPKKWLKLLASNPQFLGQLPLNLGGNQSGSNGHDKSVADRIRNQS